MSATRGKPPDRRVVRTRGQLRDALLELILEHGWDAVSVQDVCARANVGRSTFYLHFADKEDLLLSGFDEVREMVRKQHRLHAPGETLGFSRGLFQHADEHRRLFRAVVGRKSGAAVHKRFLQLVLELIREDLTLIARPETKQLVEPTARYVMGALTELLVWWIESRNPLDVVAIDALFRRMTAPMVGVLFGAERSARLPMKT